MWSGTGAWRTGDLRPSNCTAYRADDQRVTTYVHDFADLNAPGRDLLGGKGADLAEMVRIGLPVPPGFTITTEACRYYLAHGESPEVLAGQISKQLACLERKT